MSLLVSSPTSRRASQACAILPIIAIGLLVLLAGAGLAIDSSHAFLNKTRLQNAVDAAALSAAKTLNETAGNTVLATAHGSEVFETHLQGELENDTPTLTFEFSDALTPFPSNTTTPRYVRATASDFSLAVWFANVLPGFGDELTLGSTAVAGPIPLGGGQVCDIAPVLVCGDPADTNPDDGTVFGLNYGNDADTQCLKSSTSTKKNDNNSTLPDECQEPLDSVGPGNFQLIELSCGSGSNCVRESLAGEYQACMNSFDAVATKPGNSVGPVTQGLNTRFGEYSGSVNAVDHPPDLVSTWPITYSSYESAYYNEQFNQLNGVAYRRVMAVPIGNCSAPASGQSDIPLLGFGCYFLKEPTVSSGQDNWIKGHLIEDCEVSGSPGEIPDSLGSGFSTYKIILYNDPGNPAS